MPTIEILVAKSDIGLGQSVKPDDLQWQSWPAATASNNFIRRAGKAEATTEIAGSIARAPFIAGEPIREQKLVKANGSGFMAAILPTGMRAISTEISPETGAGGFILPNDRVDVILSRREQNPDSKRCRLVSLGNHPDQCPRARDRPGPEGKRGQNALVGKTATLELKPEQAETLARSRQGGTLSLALRSITDVNMAEASPTSRLRSEAKASTWFATASRTKRRHRSDRKDASMKFGEISPRCEPLRSAPCCFRPSPR